VIFFSDSKFHVILEKYVIVLIYIACHYFRVLFWSTQGLAVYFTITSDVFDMVKVYCQIIYGN